MSTAMFKSATAATENTMHSSITCNQKVICMGHTFGYCVQNDENLDDDKKIYIKIQDFGDIYIENTPIPLIS